MQGRDTSEPIACTRYEEGTDVDYGTLTKDLVRLLTSNLLTY